MSTILYLICITIGWFAFYGLTYTLATHIEGRLTLRVILIALYGAVAVETWVVFGFWCAVIIAVILAFDYKRCCDKQHAVATRHELLARLYKNEAEGRGD